MKVKKNKKQKTKNKTKKNRSQDTKKRVYLVGQGTREESWRGAEETWTTLLGFFASLSKYWAVHVPKDSMSPDEVLSRDWEAYWRFRRLQHWTLLEFWHTEWKDLAQHFRHIQQIQNKLFNFFSPKVYFILREHVCVHEWGRGRNPRSNPTGLELLSHEIMTWAEIKSRLTDA